MSTSTSARLRRALHNPVLFARHANRLYHTKGGQWSYNSGGVDVFAEEWDSLLILDACRYDMFERRSDIPGQLTQRISRGSTTVEFLRSNLHDRDLRDTVYVTANPQYYRHRGSIGATFHDVIDIWKGEGWDEDAGTVLPETVVEHALDAADRYPDKRLLIHFIQPHYPFIGSETEFDKGHLESNEGENVWGQFMLGMLDANESRIWRRYEKNLDRALPHVEQLVRTLDGRTVVSADHGNMVGERSFPIPIHEWGHPRGTYTDELLRVPWLVCES